MKLPQPEDFLDAEKDDWIKNQVEILMSEGQDCYPWTHENILEALENRKTSDELFLTSCIIAGATATNPLGAMQWIGLTVKKVIFEYWKEIAEVKADINFSERH